MVRPPKPGDETRSYKLWNVETDTIYCDGASRTTMTAEHPLGRIVSGFCLGHSSCICFMIELSKEAQAEAGKPGKEPNTFDAVQLLMRQDLCCSWEAGGVP
jgi:hypothetical protein